MSVKQSAPPSENLAYWNAPTSTSEAIRTHQKAIFDTKKYTFFVTLFATYLMLLKK